jgi:methyl-accepting chemotaxis protein WspA
MKHMTMRFRLNAAQALSLVLFLLAVWLVLHAWTTRLSAEHHTEILNCTTKLLYADLTQMSDGTRGVLFDGGSEAEKKRWSDSQGDLDFNVALIQRMFGDYPGLIVAARSLEDFATKTLVPFHGQVAQLAETDVAAATAYFKEHAPSYSRERDRLFTELAQQAERVRNSDAVQAQSVAIWSLAFGAVIVLALLPLMFFQSSGVTAPLKSLVGSLDRMRRGDFTERLQLKRADEFGVISDGLNRLADDLSQLVGQVQRSGIQVNTTATEIAATAKEQQSTANEIAATTSQIGATSKQISATSKELVKTMNEVNQVAEETANLAGSGQTAIGRMESTMRQIMDASGSITGKLAVLSEKTTNINSVVTTITKVADQTNLLSLNAAIEAEKAGEYGLGFAVVAMEIRRLADQTAVATYDIEKMVKEMQSAVAAGVMGMDKFSEEVRRGVEEIRQVSTQLAQIIHQVQTLTPRFQTVNEGMHAQATGAQQISETLTQLSEAAQQTAESLRQSNLAIEQLNGAARGLQTSVARFKLEQ